MDPQLLDLYRGVAVHATADRKLKEEEIDAIRTISDDWRDNDFTFDKYVGPAIVRAQDAVTKDEVVALIDDIDRRISSRVLRRALYSAASEVAGIDDEVSPEEGSILAHIAVRFA